jgi:hypothetical protein
MGLSAELAAARSALRAAAPDSQWAAVLAEVQRVQTEGGLSPLAALHAVYAKVAAGWTPA